jgi:hypothetical protein
MPQVIKPFLLIDMLLCVVYLANHMLGKPYSAITTLLDLDGEHGLGMWYSSMQLFCIFLLSFFFCYTKFRQDKKLLPLMILPLLFLLLSIDEAIQIHEWLGNQTDNLLVGHSRNNTPFKETGIWMFAVGIPFAIFFMAYADSIKHHFQSNQQAFKKLLLGMTIMLTGAIGMETLVNFISHEYSFFEVALEESLEMVGATIMLWAAYDMALDTLAAHPGLLTKRD